MAFIVCKPPGWNVLRDLTPEEQKEDFERMNRMLLERVGKPESDREEVEDGVK